MAARQFRQFKLDEGQGGWFRESRPHHDAYLKGQQDARRTSTAIMPYRPPVIGRPALPPPRPPAPTAAPAGSDLPPLKEGQSYQIVMVHEGGYTQLFRKTRDPKEAITLAKMGDLIDKQTGDKCRYEIIPARSIDEAREVIRNRGKSDFLVTGETYDNRHYLKAFGLKWDYNAKGYRGKLSPTQVEEIKAKAGLEVETSNEYTYEEQRESRISRAEDRAEKYEGYADNARERSEEHLEKADKIASTIPFGQPILVGHHSEAHARADAARIENNMRKGVEEANKADSYKARAEGVVTQASRVKGETERRDDQYRAAMKERLKPGDRVESFYGVGTVEKVNAKSARVVYDRGFSHTEDLYFLKPSSAPGNPEFLKKREEKLAKLKPGARVTYQLAGRTDKATVIKVARNNVRIKFDSGQEFDISKDNVEPD